MSDIIKVLPDHVANQIAAGEVVQRPASVVKELMDNSIDAGATAIKLIIKDAGRTLIQLIDNGCGMSGTDARMSFERHATSKIREAEDLYSIRTMGFRGEALASIAAVAQVEMKTRQKNTELGTLIIIEGSQVVEQSPCQCNEGTSIAVKNLFFNIPARRNFLKSDRIEFSHILNEFTRTALINPNIAFELHNDGSIVFNLIPTTLQQRIVALLGNNYRNKLLPISEKTDYVSLSGYIGKPDIAKKTRGEQFLYVNYRYIRSPYLVDAIQQAYAEFIPEGYHPSFVINIQIDPKHIDVNIHPTKTEIKFDDERTVYVILQTAVKHSLGKHILAPSFDFENETAIQLDPPPKDKVIQPPAVVINPDYNPFKNTATGKGVKFDTSFTRREVPFEPNKEEIIIQSKIDTAPEFEQQSDTFTGILHNRFILSTVKSGLLLIDRYAATERIVFERILSRIANEPYQAQGLLFPVTLKLSENDFQFALTAFDEFKLFGFEVDNFGNSTLVVNAAPAELGENDISDTLYQIINTLKLDIANDPIAERRKKTAAVLALRIASRYTAPLKKEEAIALIEQLFSCTVPDLSPSGKRCFKIFSMNELEQLLKKTD